MCGLCAARPIKKVVSEPVFADTLTMKVWLALILGAASLTAQAAEPTLDVTGLVLDVTMGSTFRIGEPISIHLTLKNPTSHPVALYALEAADVEYEVNEGESSVGGRTGQAPVIRHVGNVFIGEPDRRQRIILAPGHQLHRDLDLLSVLDELLWDGSMRLQVTYWGIEDKLVASPKYFLLHYDGDRTVKRLLQIMEEVPNERLTQDSSASVRRLSTHALSASYNLHAKFFPLMPESLRATLRLPVDPPPRERFIAAAREFRAWYRQNQRSLDITPQDYAVWKPNTPSPLK
jgi:hypothetical protein